MNASERSSTKTNLFLLIFLGIIIVITIISALNPNFGELFNIRNWFDMETLSEVSFFIAVIFTMFVCFIGALIPFPVPYPLPIALFAAAWVEKMGLTAWGFIILLVAFATFSNVIGDLIDYLIGKGAEHVLSQEDPELQDRWSQIILKKPKTIPGVIVLFGLTPLPDSLLMVPLGIVEYDVKKTLIWMYVGRFFMMSFYALVGIYAMDWLISDGGEGSGLEWIYGMALLYIIWLMIFLMVKIKPKKEGKTS